MRRLGTIVGAGVLLLLASACANPQETGEAGTDTPRGTTSQTTTESTTPDRQPAKTPPEGGTPVQKSQLDDSALPEGYPRLVWTMDDGRAVGVVAQEGGCGKASVEVPEQSASAVVLLLVETQPAEPQACTMDLRYPKITVDLDEPLGDRQVVLRAEQRKS